jgi:hypothetical protein
MRLSRLLEDILKDTGLTIVVPSNCDKTLGAPAELREEPDVWNIVYDAVFRACQGRTCTICGADEFAKFVAFMVAGSGGEPGKRHDDILSEYMEAFQKVLQVSQVPPMGPELPDLAEYWEGFCQYMPAIRRGFKAAFDFAEKL